MNETLTQVEELERFAENHRGWLFRGQSEPTWNLETSLERASRRCKYPLKELEKTVIREFQRHAHTYLHRVPVRGDVLEWLALMQHYGAPTRLLDFTYSFWIALFFAFEFSDQDCAVWALDPQSLGSKADRDLNVVLRENIWKNRHIENTLFEDVPFFTNDRLGIQKGTFVFSLNLDRPFHDLLVVNNKRIEKVAISASLFPGIRRRLNDFNCNSRVLFPGIDGFARYFQNPDLGPR